MINRTYALVLLVVATSMARAQYQHRVPLTSERIADYQRRDKAYADAQKAVARARKLVDAKNARAESAFDEVAQIYASVPDPSSEAEAQAEWSFESGDYPAVLRLSKKIDDIEGHTTSLLQLVIAECRTGHPELALPRLAQWRKQEYCESGGIIKSDLPVEIATSAQSVEATAWLILSNRRQGMGRPSRWGFLEAQRLAPRNPAIAACLVEVGILSGDFALARRNLPLTKDSKNPGIRGYQAEVAANIDRRAAAAKAKLAGVKSTKPH